MTEEHSTTAAHNAANAERRAAQTMDLGGHKVTLSIAVVVYILYLILPYAGPAHGWEALTFGTTSSGVRISIMEILLLMMLLLCPLSCRLHLGLRPTSRLSFPYSTATQTRSSF